MYVYVSVWVCICVCETWKIEMTFSESSCETLNIKMTLNQWYNAIGIAGQFNFFCIKCHRPVYAIDWNRNVNMFEPSLKWNSIKLPNRFQCSTDMHFWCRHRYQTVNGYPLYGCSCSWGIGRCLSRSSDSKGCKCVTWTCNSCQTTASSNSYPIE